MAICGDTIVGTFGTYTGKDGTDHLYGFPFKVDVKSLVWYSPDNFADAGYKVPESMEDLKALTDQIVADGLRTNCTVASNPSALPDAGEANVSSAPTPWAMVETIARPRPKPSARLPPRTK